MSNYSEEQLAVIEEAARRRAKRDPVFFINHYVKTFDPRTRQVVGLKLYPFQVDYVRELVRHINDGSDLFVEKSRDMGISWVSLAVILRFWLFEDGFMAHLGSRVENYVDDKTSKSLFWKLEFMLRNIADPLLLPEGFDMRRHRTYMRLQNPERNNEITGESSNPNFSRAGRFSVVMMDEGGFWPDFKSAWTAAGDSTNCRLLVTTPPDKPSYAKAIRFGEKIDVLTYLWSLHPHKSQEWYEHEKTRRTEEEMLHEIDISWEYSATGRVYPEIDTAPIGRFPYDASLPVYVSVDVGRDAVSINWYQPVRNSSFVNLLESYENHNKIIDWYVPLLGGDISSEYQYTDDDLALIDKVREWRKPIFYGDPSGRQTHIESSYSAYQRLQDEYGIVVQSNTLANGFIDRRDATKRILMYFRINDTPGTRYFKQCVSSARYPEKKEGSQATGEIMKPVHDWTSHHRTSLEFFSVNYRIEESSDDEESVVDDELFNEGFY